MTLKKPTIVLFDMDGTTVRHLNPQLLNILEALDDFIHKCGKLFSKIFKRKVKVPPLVEYQDGKRRKLLVHRAIHRFRRKEVDQIVEPCPGIYDVLELLRSNNIRMGIISNGLGKGYGHDILKTFDLDQYFDIRVFREDINRAKPHPDPILKATDALDPKPNSQDVIWFIGDRGKDILAALAAQSHLPCPILPFGYNLNAAVTILEKHVGADHIIMAYRDLETKLKRFFMPSDDNKDKPATST